MPQQIELSADLSIQNMYATDGRKLKTTVKEGEELMDGTKYYNANFVFDKQKEMEYILFDEGRIVNYGGNLEYEYHLKDHLGSVRVAFEPSANGTAVVQENAYYPFGAPIAEFSYAATDNKNRYLREGKEYIDDFDWNKYDFLARTFDSWILQPLQIDPLCEKYYHISPYAFCLGNPMRNIDINGDWIYIKHDGIEYTYKNGKLYHEKDKKEVEYKPEEGSFLAGVLGGLNQLNENKTGKKMLDFFNNKDSHAYVEENKEKGKEKQNGIETESNNNTIFLSGKFNGSRIQTTKGVQRSPFWLDIGHELAHRRDFIKRGKEANKLWYMSGDKENIFIPVTEQYATYWENLMRKDGDLPLRKLYEENEKKSQIIDEDEKNLFYPNGTDY